MPCWTTSAAHRRAVSPASSSIVLLIVAAIVAVRLKVGPFGKARRTEDALFVGGPRSAAEHRRAADAHAAAGEWAEAVRERLRAVIRSLEERALLDPRPGRTADEAAVEAGAALPECAAALRAAARVFDEIWYGGRTASAASDQVLRDLDEQVRTSRLGALGRPTVSATVAAPRRHPAARPHQPGHLARGPGAGLVVLGVLLAAVAVAALGGGSQAGLLDPRAVDPSGSRAVAEVLRDQGVQVQLVQTNRGLRDIALPSDTVLVAFPDLLRPEQVETVRDTGADLVVIGSHAPEQFVTASS